MRNHTSPSQPRDRGNHHNSTVRFTYPEFALLRAAAEQGGDSVSAFIRRRALEVSAAEAASSAELKHGCAEDDAEELAEGRAEGE